MKILILTTSHPYKTAGIIAKDLLENLNSLDDIQAKLLVKGWGKYKDKNIIAFESKVTHVVQWLIVNINLVLRKFRMKFTNQNKSQMRDSDYYIHDLDQTKTLISSEMILKKSEIIPDAIIVLFMHKFLNFKNLYELNKLTGAPILLYMMDMAPMTGGCHYAWDCNGYMKECGYCPALYSQQLNDQTHINYLFNKTYIEKTNIIPIAASEWQFLQLDKSSLFKNRQKFKILLPINENQYCPSDKIKAREELKLPKDKRIIFFGAAISTEKRKGLKELTHALTILSKYIADPSKIHLVIAGWNSNNFDFLLPFSFTSLGYLDHNSLPMVFQASDVFVSASIQDSGPMMINQSIMCGTPVVSFEMGVALDLVLTGKTGYLAKLKDNVDLAKGIFTILSLEKNKYIEMSNFCRKYSLSMYSPSLFLKSFVNILENLKN